MHHMILGHMTPTVHNSFVAALMASMVQDLKGYDHQFLDKYSEDLICMICLHIARDPQQLSCCGKLLCKGCLDEHNNHSSNCPQCGTYVTSFPDKKSKFVLYVSMCATHK